MKQHLSWTVILQTTPLLFLAWLERTTQMVWTQQFPTEKGYVTLSPARKVRDLLGGGYRIELAGAYNALRTDEVTGEEVLNVWPHGYYISFDVVPVASDRVQVVASCHQPVLADYFDWLHGEIVATWPEAAPPQGNPAKRDARGAEKQSSRRLAPGTKRVDIPYKDIQKAYWDLHDQDYQHPSFPVLAERLQETLGRNVSDRTVRRRVLEYRDQGLPWPPPEPDE